MEWTVNSLRDLDCGFSGNISKIARDFGKQIQKRLFTLMTDYKLTLFFLFTSGGYRAFSVPVENALVTSNSIENNTAIVRGAIRSRNILPALRPRRGINRMVAHRVYGSVAGIL